MKGKNAAEGDCEKSWSELKRKGELIEKRWGWRLAWWGLAWWGFTEKKEASRLLGLIGRHQYSDQRSNRNRASLCSLRHHKDRRGGGPNGHVVNIIMRAADGRWQTNRQIIDKKRVQNGYLQNTLRIVKPIRSGVEKATEFD